MFALSLRPGVGQTIAFHALQTARNSTWLTSAFLVPGLSWLLTEPRKDQPVDDSLTLSDNTAGDLKPFDVCDYESEGKQSRSRMAVRVQPFLHLPVYISHVTYCGNCPFCGDKFNCWSVRWVLTMAWHVLTTALSVVMIRIVCQSVGGVTCSDNCSVCGDD